MSDEHGDADVRILLVDDHQLVRLGFRLLLDAQPGLRVVGEAGDGAEALQLSHLLSMSEATVKTHLRRIMAKLDLHDRAQVVAFAYATRLVWPP